MKFIILITIVLLVIYNFTPSKSKSDLASPITADRKVHIPKVTDVFEYYGDLVLEPYGCFTNIKDKFFIKKINPYSKLKIYDSGIMLSEDDADIDNLVQRVIKNGYDIYGHKIFDKYQSKGYSKITIQELGILGKLAGYNYLSIYKNNEGDRGKIYLTYSPPMDIALPEKYTETEYKKYISKSDLPGYVLTPEKGAYTNDQERAPGKEFACGYPCENNTFIKDGKTRQYMCGSAAYPGIKTPPRWAVYHIAEKI